MDEKMHKLSAIIHASLLNPALLPYWIAALVILILVFFTVKQFQGKRKLTSWQALFLAMTFSWYFLTFSYTVLSRPYNPFYLVELIPFWSYRDVIFDHSGSQLYWILVNLAMFVPIGFLLPLWKKNLTWKKVIMIAAVLSYLIEFSQLFLHRGNFELFDDPIDNIAGCLIGFAVGKYIQNKFRKQG